MREEFQWFTYSFDQQTDMVTLDRPAVHGGTGVDPLHNYSNKTSVSNTENNQSMQSHDNYSDYT